MCAWVWWGFFRKSFSLRVEIRLLGVWGGEGRQGAEGVSSPSPSCRPLARRMGKLASGVRLCIPKEMFPTRLAHSKSGSLRQPARQCPPHYLFLTRG